MSGLDGTLLSLQSFHHQTNSKPTGESHESRAKVISLGQEGIRGLSLVSVDPFGSQWLLSSLEEFP